MNLVVHALNGWPLLVYPQVTGSISPEYFENLFTRNRWPAAWRNGVFPFHHYHPNSHEVLGVYEGEVTVQFGGDAGPGRNGHPGDVIVLPAGTAHKKLSARGSLGIVGAYPEGSRPEKKRGFEKHGGEAPLPACDPVHGPGGPLFKYWT